jgi:hypothetical protein
MPETIPTLQEVVVHALHSARLEAVQETGNDKVIVAVPTVGVCCIINQDGPLLKREDLSLVQSTLDELAATSGYVKQVPTQAGPGYIILPDAPPGRSATAAEPRPAFAGPCGSPIPTGGDTNDARRQPQRTHRRRGQGPR